MALVSKAPFEHIIVFTSVNRDNRYTRKVTLKHIVSISPLRQFPPPLVNSDPNVRRSSIVCIAHSSHLTAVGIECGIALLAWTSFAPKGHTGCIIVLNSEMDLLY